MSPLFPPRSGVSYVRISPVVPVSTLSDEELDEAIVSLKRTVLALSTSAVRPLRTEAMTTLRHLLQEQARRQWSGIKGQRPGSPPQDTAHVGSQRQAA